MLEADGPLESWFRWNWNGISFSGVESSCSLVWLGVESGRSGLGGRNKSGGAEGWVWAWWYPHHVKGQQSGTMVVGGCVVQGNTWLASPWRCSPELRAREPQSMLTIIYLSRPEITDPRSLGLVRGNRLWPLRWKVCLVWWACCYRIAASCLFLIPSEDKEVSLYGKFEKDEKSFIPNSYPQTIVQWGL